MTLARGPDPLREPLVPTQPAVIGDALRRPAAWCEMYPCISHFSDPGALGEADVRARAIAAGWRVDAFGRLACWTCQQRDPRFRATQPVVRWDWRAAVTRTAQAATAGHQHNGASGSLPVPPARLAPLPAAPLLAPPLPRSAPRSHRDRGRHRREA